MPLLLQAESMRALGQTSGKIKLLQMVDPRYPRLPLLQMVDPRHPRLVTIKVVAHRLSLLQVLAPRVVA